MSIALLIGLLVGLLVGITIGAVILRAAVALSNKMVGGSIPEPGFGKAALAIIAVGVVSFVANVAIGLLTGGAATAMQAQQATAVGFAQLASLPVGFLLMAGLITAMLPTTFGRGALVTALTYVISILIGVFTALVVFMVSALT